MTAIALAESGGRTDVINVNKGGSVDHGVWQINDSNDYALAIGDWRDPGVNARMAYAVFKKQGYGAWSVFNHGTYAQYLSKATTGATNPVEPALSVPNPVQGLELLTNPHTYLRLAMFAGGCTLLTLGLFMMGWDVVPDSLKSSANAAVKTQARTAAKGNKVAETVVKTAAKGK
jgi:hypothetical protein